MTSKMATTRSSTRSQPGIQTADQFVNKKRGKARGRISDSTTSSDKYASLSDTVAKLRTNHHSGDSSDMKDLKNCGEGVGDMPPSPSLVNTNSKSQQHLPSLSPTHPLSEEPESTLTPPKPFDGNLTDLASIAKAITSLQEMMVHNHLRLERKLDSSLNQIDEKMANLNAKLESQDEAFFRLRENMVDKSKFHGLEDTLADVASQADEKFIDIDTDLSDLRSAITHLRTENLRLNHRLSQVEE